MEIEPFSLTVDEISIVGELHLPEEGGPSPALCICHGIPSGKPADPADRGYPHLAEQFCSSGFITAIFNFRGTGTSGGNFDMMGWGRDIETVLDFLYSRSEVDRSRLCLMGFSGGAAASAYVAAHDRRVTKTVLCACPAEFRGFISPRRSDFSIDHFRQIGLIRDEKFPHSLDDWLDNFREITPIKWIDQISPRPVLILQGENDDLVEASQAWRLYEKAKEPKLITIIGGAGHKLRLSDKAMHVALEWLIET